MSVYVITGVSRGIGFEFLKQLSEDPNNLVIGLVRDKATTEKRVAAELTDRTNIRIVYADLTKHATLRQAAAETAQVVGDRGVDYLVANGAYLSLFDAYAAIGTFTDRPDEMDKVLADLFQTNVTGNIHLFHAFLPLVQKGKAKKVVALTTGLADLDFTSNYDVEIGALYAASKAALNIIVAKFSAQYKKEGILFLGISPGVVEVGRNPQPTPEQLQGLSGFVGKLVEYAPDFKGPITPEVSVRHVRSVWEKASIEDRFGGAFVSHFGNKKWV